MSAKKAPATLININGDVREASSLSIPNVELFRLFRGAAQFEGNVITTDMFRAKDIQKNNIRAERAPELEALDIQTMKALETGGDVAPIAAEKQKLRDVTKDQRIEDAKTPEELKALDLNTLLQG